MVGLGGGGGGGGVDASGSIRLSAPLINGTKNLKSLLKSYE